MVKQLPTKKKNLKVTSTYPVVNLYFLKDYTKYEELKEKTLYSSLLEMMKTTTTLYIKSVAGPLMAISNIVGNNLEDLCVLICE